MLKLSSQIICFVSLCAFSLLSRSQESDIRFDDIRQWASTQDCSFFLSSHSFGLAKIKCVRDCRVSQTRKRKNCLPLCSTT